MFLMWDHDEDAVSGCFKYTQLAMAEGSFTCSKLLVEIARRLDFKLGHNPNGVSLNSFRLLSKFLKNFRFNFDDNVFSFKLALITA